MHWLQPTVLGSCRKKHTVPKPSNKKSVQPLNVGDHWITVTKVLSTCSNEIQLDDSSYRMVNDSTVLQCSSVFRLHEQDSIAFTACNYAHTIIACEEGDTSATVFDDNILKAEVAVRQMGRHHTEAADEFEQQFAPQSQTAIAVRLLSVPLHIL